MQLVLNVPEISKKSPHQQEQIRKFAETRLRFELELEEREKQGYSSVKSRILREALYRASLDKITGISREKAFDRLFQTIDSISEELQDNKKYQDFLKDIENNQ